MRKGFTTGSCAAAAAGAAAWMLLGGCRREQISIITPAGIPYRAQVEDISISVDSVSCAVRKDSGDDPDVTDQMLIYASVRRISHAPDEADDAPAGSAGRISSGEGSRMREVHIRGGTGIGKITRPGLDQEVGSDAINSVPRAMIEKEVRDVMELYDYRGGLEVEIFAPEGEAVARRTFNPGLGIEGGISIIGTTGIVEPMSTKAILDTIRIGISQKRAMGAKTLVVVPGNYGIQFLKDRYGFSGDQAVRCSNFIGDTVDMAAEAGISKLVLCGHVGKLVKLSGGIMNTHSREGDCRMELLAAAAIRCHVSEPVPERILACVSAEEACGILLEEGAGRQCFDLIMERIRYYLGRRAGDRMKTECLMYSNRYGLLGATAGAAAALEELNFVSRCDAKQHRQVTESASGNSKSACKTELWDEV